MERLTCWLTDGVAGIASALEEKYTAEKVIDILALRLAAYEDSELPPERVAELAYAEWDGRLVVLPCKVGDTVYRLLAPTRRIIEREIRTVGEAADVARWLNNKSSIVQVYLTREEAEAARETLRKEGDNG